MCLTQLLQAFSFDLYVVFTGRPPPSLPLISSYLCGAFSRSAKLGLWGMGGGGVKSHGSNEIWHGLHWEDSECASMCVRMRRPV